MNLPTLSRCACKRPPDWFSPSGGPLGRYQHQCPSGDWAATRGPISEPEARREWDQHFGAGIPQWPYEVPLHIPAVPREERP